MPIWRRYRGAPVQTEIRLPVAGPGRTKNGKVRIVRSFVVFTASLTTLAQLQPYLNRKFSLESPAIDLQPISLMSRAISSFIKSKARSTPACPATANG